MEACQKRGTPFSVREHIFTVREHIFTVREHIFAVRDKNVLQMIVSLPSEIL